MMARANPNHLDNTGNLDQMDQQSLRAILARAEAMSEQIRSLLASATPKQSLPQPPTSSTPKRAQIKMASRLANITSQSPDGHSDTSMNLDAADSAILDTDPAKSPASPATTDDVPAMTQGEKTPVQGDQSPAAPLPLEESVQAGPATPTKAAALGGDEPVVLESGGDGDEKTLGEGALEDEI